VGRDGKVLRRYSPGSPLEQGMEDDVRRALKGEPLKERKGVF
jgi:glutathione peroxidase